MGDNSKITEAQLILSAGSLNWMHLPSYDIVAVVLNVGNVNAANYIEWLYSVPQIVWTRIKMISSMKIVWEDTVIKDTY